MDIREPVDLAFFPLETTEGGSSPFKLATITINRPSHANAFDGDMLVRVTELIEQARTESGVRLLVFQGAGSNFTGGADLQWMLESTKLPYDANLADATKLTTMLEALSSMEIPTVAVVKGATFGIGVGIVACCDFAIADIGSIFCLNEVKLGMIPSVVLPYINRKMACGQLRRHVLGGKKFSATDAKEFDLIQVISTTFELEANVRGELNQLLKASLEAQGSYKRLQKYLGNNSYQQGPYTAAATAIARASDFGQVGLRAFLQKEPAPWICRIPESTRFLAPNS